MVSSLVQTLRLVDSLVPAEAPPARYLMSVRLCDTLLDVSQTLTVGSSALVASVAGGNSTVSSASDIVLDLAATVDPDEVLNRCTQCLKYRSPIFGGGLVRGTQQYNSPYEACRTYDGPLSRRKRNFNGTGSVGYDAG